MIILASKSPRRKELLSFITTDFAVKSADVDETLPQGISPDKAVEYLSKIKAEPFKNENDIVIGADTVVALDGKILGKPRDDADAFATLKMLSGREHSVFTGVSVIKGENIDKAGSYGIQGKGSLLVEKIDGDYFNVVGLPISRLNRVLKLFNR